MFSKGCPVTSHPPFPSVCFQMSFRSQGSIGSISVIRGIVGGVKFEMQNKKNTNTVPLSRKARAAVARKPILDAMRPRRSLTHQIIILRHSGGIHRQNR